jgi:hypothetical protein
MASLTDLGSGAPSSDATGLSLASAANDPSSATENAGINSQRALEHYNDVALPQLQSHWASQGNYWGGQARVAADQLSLQTYNQVADYQRLLASQLADMARNRVLSIYGGIA